MSEEQKAVTIMIVCACMTGIAVGGIIMLIIFKTGIIV